MLVDREGRVKVADFGIARGGASEMTEAGSIVGTAQYLSPEQARGAPVDEEPDLYSTDRPLRAADGDVSVHRRDAVEIAMKHLSQTPGLLGPAPATFPHDLDLVVLRASPRSLASATAPRRARS